MFCETCGELICWKCIAKGSKHHDHDYEELDLVYDKYKAEVKSLLEPIEKQVTTVTSALAMLDTRRGEISSQRTATADKVNRTFSLLHEVLHVRETELISQLDQMTQSKLKDLTVQRDQIETNLAQLHWKRIEISCYSIEISCYSTGLKSCIFPENYHISLGSTGRTVLYTFMHLS